MNCVLRSLLQGIFGVFPMGMLNEFFNASIPCGLARGQLDVKSYLFKRSIAYAKGITE